MNKLKPHAEILVNALECQVSWGDTNGVVGYYYNLAYASK